MKVHIELEMSPEEARRMMGLPDVAKLQEEMAKELQSRMKSALQSFDPQELVKTWFPFGTEPFDQFQRFLKEAARGATAGPSKPTKSER
jgi:hypothetical protein